MLMREATPEMVTKWKEVWSEYNGRLHPNRKSGKEVVEYLKNKYLLEELHDDNLKQIVINNVRYNKPYADKLPDGVKTSAVTFLVENKDKGKFLYENQDEVFKGTKLIVGVELISGFFFVEGSSFLWDELFVFQGLDEKDIQNYFLVAEYISCLKRYGLLESVLNK